MATATPAAAATGGAADAPASVGQGLSQAAALVLRALQCTGSAATAEHYGQKFRRWAQEGKAYRGQVFSTEDVDVAIEAYRRSIPSKVQEEQADLQKPQSTVRLCTVKASKDSPWPTSDVLAASQEIVDQLGQQSRQINAAAKLLPLLHKLAGAGAGPAPGDVCVRCADGLVSVHCKILSAASRMLQCKFDGRFNAGSRDVDASGFKRTVVQAAVSFIYLGECQLPMEEIHFLFALADLWQVFELMAAVLLAVSEMPPIECLKVLSEWEDCGHSCGGPERFSAALVERAAWGFKQCTENLKPLPRTALVLAQAPRRGDDEDGWARESRKAFAELEKANAPIWSFFRELCTALEKIPENHLARLRNSWVMSSDGASEFREDRQEGSDDNEQPDSPPLAQALVNCFSAALGAGRREELRLLATVRTFILPHFSALRVVRQMSLASGIVDESGSVLPWVYWTHAGGLSFTQLWSYYNMLRRCPRRPMMPELGQPTALPDLLGGGGGNTDGDPLPEDLEKEFAMAFAGSLEQDSQAAVRWESLLVEDPNGVRWPALEESVHLLARFIQSLPSRLASLPPAGALRVLRIAVAALPSAALQLSGAEANELAGLYHATNNTTTSSASQKSRVVKKWLRDGVAESKLELRKVPRPPQELWAVHREDLATTGLRFLWKGVPEEVLRNARTEWKIQPAEDDPYVDIPRALAFDEVQDPADISGPWWIFNSKQQKFHRRHSIALSREAVEPAAAAPFVAALRAWANHRAAGDASGGAVASHFKELETCLAGGECGSQSHVLLQLCHSAAAQATPRTGKAPETPQEVRPQKPPLSEALQTLRQKLAQVDQGSTSELGVGLRDGDAGTALKDPSAPQAAPEMQSHPQAQKRSAPQALPQSLTALRSAEREAQSPANTKQPPAREVPPAKVRPQLKEEPPTRVRPQLQKEPPTKVQRTDAGLPPKAPQAMQQKRAHEVWARAFEASQKAHEEERAHYRRWREASEAARLAREAEEAARKALDALGGA